MTVTRQPEETLTVVPTLLAAGQSANASQPVGAAPTPPQPTVTVIFDSGTDAGTHIATADPTCAYGTSGPAIWSAFYADISAGPTDLSEVQVSDEPDLSGKANARIFSAFISVVGRLQQ